MWSRNLTFIIRIPILVNRLASLVFLLLGTVFTQPLPHLDFSATSKMILEDMILGKGKDVVSLRLSSYSGQHLELRLCLYWAQASFFVFMLRPG
jgi:hypothetical protein